MNHSIYSADRTTHAKIVVAALVAAIGVAGFGIAVRVNTGHEYSQTAQVTKTKARLEDGKSARRLASLVPPRSLQELEFPERSWGPAAAYEPK